MKVAIHIIIMKMMSSIIASFLCSRCHEGDRGGRSPVDLRVCLWEKKEAHFSLAHTYFNLGMDRK